MKSPEAQVARIQPDEEPVHQAKHLTDSLLALLDLCARYMTPADLALVRTAYAQAEAAHSGTLRRSGEPFIEHPLAVARILAELAMDASGIAAALLHDTVEDTTLTLDEVRERFGPVIAGIVDGVTKFTAVEAAGASLDGLSTQPQSNGAGEKHGVSARGNAEPIDAAVQRARKAKQRQETVRKLFLAMSAEPRVVLLKLADRLHNMRTLESMNEVQRARTAQETLDIFAPLAGRIGLYLVKSELEDLAFSYTEPTYYQQTVVRLADEAMKRATWVERMVQRMRRELAAEGIGACVNWRLKRPYRAWREAQESGMDVGNLHDLIAFRVLVETKRDCYQALRVIHHLWHPHGDRIRDYIATPKANGYQSFHTAIFALDGRLAQIHIRTHQMHRAAQHGMATYWLERAAQGAPHEDEATPMPVDRVFSWVTQLASWHRELGMSAADFEATVRGDILPEEQVYVFTPKGHIRELPDGATVLDLAYQIHTAIGDHATGAVVQTNTSDGLLVTREVPVDYALRRGDVVRINTQPTAHPSVEWLSIARTRYAQEKIRRALRKLDAGPSSSVRRDEAPLVEAEGYVPQPLRHPAGRAARVRLAHCCYPCPGDVIAGLAQGGGIVTVHRACCRVLIKALADRAESGVAHAEPVRVSWPEIQPIAYCIDLIITGQDYAGLMHALSECAASMGLSVTGSAAYAIADRKKAAVNLTLEVPHDKRLEQVYRRLKAVPGVVSVERDLSKGCGERIRIP